MRALFSQCGRYRHLLNYPGTHQCGWIMLNPSTAGSVDADTGEVRSDPTQKKVGAFSRSWGYDGYVIANVYDLVSTDPRGLWADPAPVSPANASYLAAVATLPLVVVAWGRNAKADRVAQVVKWLRDCGARDLWALGVNDDGSPKHPLYIPYNAKLCRWSLTNPAVTGYSPAP